MRIIIDRLEGDYAVAELGEQMLNLPRVLFPNAKEGDTVEITVLGKLPPENSEPPHEIFERLRRKSRAKNAAKPRRGSKAAKQPESSVESDENAPASPEDPAQESC